MSENISVRSILGRFLEHSRIYLFEIGDEVEVYLGSADLMTRNLDRRIEIVVPVEQARLRQELDAVFDSAFADTSSAWELALRRLLDAAQRGKGERAHSHQVNLQRRADCARAGREVRAAGEQLRGPTGCSQNDGHEGRGHRRRLEHGAPAGRRGGRRRRPQRARGEAHLGLGAEVLRHGGFAAAKLAEARR